MRIRSAVLAATLTIATSTVAQTPPVLPWWAYPVGNTTPAGWTTAALPPAAPRVPDNGSLKKVEGSAAGYTSTQINDLYVSPDWFPDSHPAMPEIVSVGRKAASIGACGHCHLPNGQGRPENQSVTGLPAGYILGQLADFKNGLRKGSETRMGSVNLMITIAKNITDDEAKAAAAYFSSFKLKPWVRVVETATVPATRGIGTMLVPIPGAPMEPIGMRIIETPENLERTELRDTTAGFVAYAPIGSLKKGEDLVTTGGNGKTIRCTICHGADLRGIGNVPSIAGRSPSQMARQIIDIQNGVRNGGWSQLMKETVSKLTNDDIVPITAYLASRQP